MATLQTTAGQIVGTLPYMSPEQLDGNRVEIDGRSDVYALGVILFQLLTGRLPVDVKGRPVVEAARILRDQEPSSLSSVDTALRGDLDTIVAKALEKKRERRYASAADLAADLERHLAHQPIVARPANQFYLLRKFARRHRAIVAGSALALLALVIGLAISIRSGIEEARLRRIAQTREADARLADYRSALVAAQALLESDPRGAFQILERAPQELRHWEWRYLRALLDPAARVHPSPTSAGAAATAWDAGWNPSGALTFAAAGPGGLELTDPSTGALRMVDGRVTDAAEVALSIDGTRVAALWSGKSRVDTWSVGPTGCAHLTSLAVPEAGGHLTLSADGSTLALVSSKQRVSAFDVDSGAERFSQPTGRISGLDLWPDGSRCLVASRGHNGFLIVDGHGSEVFSYLGPRVAIGPRGERLAHQGEVGVQLRTIATRETLATFGGEGQSARAIAFDPGGARIALAEHDAIRLWDIDTLQPAETLHRPVDAAPVDELMFDDTGERLLERSPDGVRTYDLGSTGGRPVRGLGAANLEAVFHPTLPLVASNFHGRNRQQVRVASPDGRTSLAELDFDRGRLHGLAFSDDGRDLIALFDANASAWSLPADPWSEPWPEQAREVDPDEFWSLTRGRSVFVMNQRVTQSASQDRGGTHRIVGTSSGYELFDARTGELIAHASTSEGAGEGKRVAVVALDPQGDVAATGHSDGSITLWRAREGEWLATLRGHQRSIYSLEFDPTGERLASGGRDGTLRLWHVESGIELLALRAGPHSIHSVAFSPDGSQILTTVASDETRLWHSVPPRER